MAIFLSVLKIIGIVLLIILAVLLLLVLLLLFVPLRYKANGGYRDEKYEADAKVTWLLHIISVKFHIDNDKKSCIVRLFGIKLMDLLNPKPKKEKKPKKPEKEKKKSDSDGFIDEDDYFSDTKPAGSSDPASCDELPADNEEEEDIPFPDKVEMFFEFLCEKAVSIYGFVTKKYEETSEKAYDTYKTIDAWIYVLSKDKTKQAIEKVKNDLIKFLKHIAPRKGKAFLKLGLEDPATTGTIYGYYWMFIGVYAGIFEMMPVFDDKVIEADGSLKGHIRLNHVLSIGWKFLFNKKYKYLRKIQDRVDYVKEHKK